MMDIENNTWVRENMEFLFECSTRCLMSERSELTNKNQTTLFRELLLTHQETLMTRIFTSKKHMIREIPRVLLVVT